MKIEREYSKADLVDFTEILIQKANLVHFKITKNQNEKVNQKLSNEFLFETSRKEFREL